MWGQCLCLGLTNEATIGPTTSRVEGAACDEFLGWWRLRLELCILADDPACCVSYHCLSPTQGVCPADADTVPYTYPDDVRISGPSLETLQTSPAPTLYFSPRIPNLQDSAIPATQPSPIHARQTATQESPIPPTQPSPIHSVPGLQESPTPATQPSPKSASPIPPTQPSVLKVEKQHVFTFPPELVSLETPKKLTPGKPSSPTPTEALSPLTKEEAATLEVLGQPTPKRALFQDLDSPCNKKPAANVQACPSSPALKVSAASPASSRMTPEMLKQQADGEFLGPTRDKARCFVA